MPKRSNSSSSNSSPKKSRASPTKVTVTRSNSRKLEELAGSDEEVTSAAKSSPVKSLPPQNQNQYTNNSGGPGYIVEEDLGEDQDSNQQLLQESEAQEASVNGQATDKKENVVGMNPTLALDSLRVEFFESVHQYYAQLEADAEAEDDDEEDEDDEFVVDIAVVKRFRALYCSGEEELLTDRKAQLDHLFREYLLEEVTLRPANAAKRPWPPLLELSIKLAREEISSPPVPIWLLTDLVELSPLTECDSIFAFIEERLSIWKESVFNSCRTAVLRLCNDLLRRLSREQDTILCGRILIFLSNYFPLSERSGLNVQSDFNTENVTAYKTQQDDDPEDKMEADVGAEGVDRVEKLFEGIEVNIPGLETMIEACRKESGTRIRVDYGFYIKFWSLQEFFREPSRVYNKLVWRTFVGYTTDVLSAYKSYKLEEPPAATNLELELDPGIRAGATTSTMNSIPKVGDYFPKYLTNKRLLELQMGDGDCRRFFLVQLLIVFQYFTSKVKFRQETQVLSEEQLAFVRKTEEDAYELLTQIPPDGSQFVANLKRILKSEEVWNQWKNEGCPSFKRPASFAAANLDPLKEGNADTGDVLSEQEEGAITIEDALKSTKRRAPRREVGDVIQESVQKGKHLMGNPELTRLWNLSADNMEACRIAERKFMPPIETFFAEAVKELDDPTRDPTPPTTEANASANAKKEVKPKKILGNASFGWRALRLLARQSPLFFQIHTGSPISPLQSYLEFILKKIITEAAAEQQAAQTQGQGGKQAVDNGGAHALANAVNSNEQEIGMNIDADADAVASDPKDEDDEGEQEDEEIGADVDAGTPTSNRPAEGEEEDGPGLRTLTEDEQVKLGKALGSEWKKLALKLAFKKDEIDFFETEKKDSAAAWMLKMWTEQEGDDASVADLLYVLEGLGLKDKAEAVINL